MKESALTTIGYGVGSGSPDMQVCMGPLQLQDSDLLKRLPFTLDWLATLYPREQHTHLDAIFDLAEVNHRLALFTAEQVKQRQKFLVSGGDHTSAIGTWSGASYALAEQGPIGLIWCDAHMDSHTPDSSESKNVHGMPLATLLGYGAPSLTTLMSDAPKLKPEYVCHIGARSYESAERALLERLNVKVYYIEEVKARGIDRVLNEAIEHVSRHTAGFGLSIDIDIIDPIQAPAVTTPAPDGVDGKAFVSALKHVKSHSTFIGAEIVEFNPHKDQNKKTECLIVDMIDAMFSLK